MDFGGLGVRRQRHTVTRCGVLEASLPQQQVGQSVMGLREMPIEDRPEIVMSGEAVDQELERKLNMSLAELELSVRATNCLESEGITTVRDLVIRTDEELLEVRNFGETTLREVKQKLVERGLQLGMKLPASMGR